MELTLQKIQNGYLVMSDNFFSKMYMVHLALLLTLKKSRRSILCTGSKKQMFKAALKKKLMIKFDNQLNNKSP